jgi:AcrR family transcriptional regulator
VCLQSHFNVLNGSYIRKGNDRGRHRRRSKLPIVTVPEPKRELQRDAERTRAEVLAVATEVFAESGYSGARVDEIAQRTRTTKRMIYYYFGGKEGLYLAVLENAYRGIREAEQKLQVDHVDPVVAMRRLAELTFDHHLDHQAFIRLVSIENIHRGEFIGRIDSLRTISKPATSILEDILARGRDQGAFRDDVDALDVHIVISSYCVFQVANKHTFGFLFGVDFTELTQRAHMRRMIGDVVVGWLTSR